MRRVCITGMGVISPVGNDIDTFWDAIKNGRTGFGPITKFDTTDFKVKLAAEVKDFDPEKYMEKKSARRMELFCQYAIAASKQAMDDSGIDMDKEDPYRIGCFIGNGVGSMQAFEREHKNFLDRGPSRVSASFVPLLISNMAAGNVSIMFGLKGKNINVVTACATGTNSIGEAFRSIQHGEIDAALAGGCEAAVSPMGIAGFSSMTALTTSDVPEKCSIPFDKERSGFVMGEGAGVVLLEELEHAMARKAHIYGEVIGYGCSADAFHITSPEESGAGAARAMLNAVKDAELKPEDITYINAHGTSTHHNDLFETRAIKLAFGEHAGKIKINSTKSMTGHLLGGAGAVEFITCALELQKGFIHRTVGFNEAEEEMNLDYCRNSYEEEFNYALSNSLGFGGHNASIILKKWEE